MTAIAILILAAGSASRMRGRDKLLEEIDGTPLLARICGAALGTGQDTYVTLPAAPHPRAQLLSRACPAATALFVPDAQEGMAASIRSGIAGLTKSYEAVMILPADMPELTQADLAQVAGSAMALPDRILRATGTATGADTGSITGAQERFGHPVVFPRRYFAALGQLSGDQGARAVLKAAQDQGETIHPVPLPEAHALTDLDTPEAWTAWRRARTTFKSD
ncbi:nucleotidyltransferase family protein [Phaeobacter sp. JH18-32]|uniref:nucleotidyltransferase family protein n=1 Tax=Phaeobacter TaxID=302485 RepID=UPI003A8969A6